MSSAAKPPIVVVCALIERDGHVLVAQRPAHKHLGLKWEFPGGKVEPGEAAETALVREIQEELGCRIEPVSRPALARITHAYESVTIEMTPFVARLAADGGEPFAHEHAALRWVRPEELSSLDLAAADVPIVADYLNHATAGKTPPC